MQFIEDVRKFQSNKITLNFLDKNRPSFKVCTISTAVIEAAHKSLANKSKPVEIQL